MTPLTRRDLVKAAAAVTVSAWGSRATGWLDDAPTPPASGHADDCCDTLVALPTATADGTVIFAKNSDRLADECQHLKVFPEREWNAGTDVRCQYLTIPQARRTYRVLGSQPFWLWGFEHGVNEKGVAIGNEAIWTKAARQASGLLGMDLLRLGLERGATAREALETIAALLEEFGQGGSPRHNDAKAPCYDSSFILADPKEAWVLETSSRDWVARRVEGSCSISNRPTIGVDFDKASRRLSQQAGLNFARDLGDYEKYPQTSGQARCARSGLLLRQGQGKLTVADMMSILRDHGADANWQPSKQAPTICMHAGTGQTAASMVVHLRPQGFTAWCSMLAPCCSVFLPFFIDTDVPVEFAKGEAKFSQDSPWWRLKRLVDFAGQDWAARTPQLRARYEPFQRNLLRDAANYETASRDKRVKWVASNAATLLREIEQLEKELLR